MKILSENNWKNPELKVSKVGKIDYEFQALGVELQPIYGKVIWTLFHKKGMTEAKIRDAAKIAKSRGKENFPYLIGILKKLK